jgi:hypothetical protein
MFGNGMGEKQHVFVYLFEKNKVKQILIRF